MQVVDFSLNLFNFNNKQIEKIIIIIKIQFFKNWLTSFKHNLDNRLLNFKILECV